ncbi:MAG: secretin N-terminal domain-containing protein, partial [Rhodanobacter sp.]
RTNALVVISTQPQYLEEVGDWITTIDRGGGNQPQLFVYDVRNIKASDLAKYLAQIYTNGAGNGGDSGGKVGPGLSGGTLGSADNTNGSSMGSTAGSFGNSGGLAAGSGGLGGTGGLGGSTGTSGFGSSMGTPGSESRDGSSSLGGSAGMAGGSSASSSEGGSGSGDQQYTSSDGSVRISSVDTNQQLLVRARPAQWEEMKAAIRKLDNVPLQVQIETRILEVTLSGDLQFGVQWYLDGLTGSTFNADGSVNKLGQPYRHRQVGLGGGGNAYNAADSLFYSFINSKMQVALSALETSGNTKTLSAPSMVVLNNQKAHIQVGNQIPINQTSLIGLGGAGTTDTTASSVTYLPTGVILDVQPRVNPGGLVYLNVHQQVSTPGVQNAQGNYTIAQRDVATQVAVQSGQTVLLGGLIQQDESNTDDGIPVLNRIPVLGRLFGTTERKRDRTELIVLITPRVIRGAEDARQITDDYQGKFESLAPLRASANKVASSSGAPSGYEPPAANTPLPGAPYNAAPSWPEQLQQHAETALQQGDYTSAQDMAMQSWKQGTRHGNLCERNWQVVSAVRKHNGDPRGVDAARKSEHACLLPAALSR